MRFQGATRAFDRLATPTVTVHGENNGVRRGSLSREPRMDSVSMYDRAPLQRVFDFSQYLRDDFMFHVGKRSARRQMR